MDASFNLLVFGLNGKDFNAGTQDAWTTNTPATDITTSGRPPFNGANTTCFLAQFFNAVYVLSADASNPTAVYIYDATAKSWSTQAVQNPTGSPAFDPSDFKAILDHDTNVLYALSQGELFFLDMGSERAANSSPIAWTDVGKPSFNTQGYEPVMALAQNHIHFIDVPGLPDGDADIFVIHFSFFQPTPQAYPVTGSGASFPQQHGQTASFFLAQGVQEEFAYIPDDGSATYVINVQSNTTQQLAAPEMDLGAQYFAGITSLVQLDSQGNLFFLPYNPNNTASNQGVNWKSITNIPSEPSDPTSTASGSQSAASPKNTQNNNGGTAGAASPSTTGTPASSGAEAAFGAKFAMTALLAVLSFAATIGLAF